ncbi:hypothetical protein ACROYT_G014594 [Oculina patagonica]
MLEGFTDPGINIPATQKLLKDGKRYLKNDFKTHIGRDEQCSDHCTVHALSDSTSVDLREECNHQHSYECERCESLEGVLEELAEMLDKVDMMEEERAMLKFEYTESVRKIKGMESSLAGIKYPKRSQAKCPPETRRDIMPCDNGLSNEISACPIQRTEDLLHKVKQEYPLVTKAYLRSNNARCYHNGPLLLSLREVGERTGVRPVRYDFSEPQAGKDICDRKTAAIKAHMKRWVNERHNIVTAEDMKTALESHGGIKGCRATVVDVDTTREKNQDSKISGISVLNNFQYEECDI